MKPNSLSEIQTTMRRNTSVILMYVVLIIFSIPFLYPFWWMITSSLKPLEDIFDFPPRLLPKELFIENYKNVFELQPFAQQFWNSLYIAVAVTLGVLLFASLAGYAFAR